MRAENHIKTIDVLSLILMGLFYTFLLFGFMANRPHKKNLFAAACFCFGLKMMLEYVGKGPMGEGFGPRWNIPAGEYHEPGRLFGLCFGLIFFVLGILGMLGKVH